MAPEAHVSYPADGVGLVLLDDPPKNFGSPALYEKVYEGVIAVKEAGSRVVVIASDVPGYFIAHYSLRQLVDTFSGGGPAPAPADAAARRPNLQEELERGPMISIAANNGQAWGGGSEFSWSCNLRIAAESATYGQPEVALGIIPGGGGTSRLARLVGMTKCMEMIVDGHPISAREALAIGAINRVVPDDQLREEAIAWAARIARWPAFALEACKRSMLEGIDMPLLEARRNEGLIFREVAVKDEALRLMSEAQAKYESGADSYEAIGLDRRDGS